MNNHIPKTCILIGEDNLLIDCADILIDRGIHICKLVSPLAQAQKWAFDRGIPYFSSFASVKDDLLADKKVDYFFSVVNSEIFPLEIISRISDVAINYHNGPLPLYAGVNVTSWAILNDEKKHGVTWHHLSDKVDGGDIVKQEMFPIDHDETALSLDLKCYQHGILLFEKLVDDIVIGKLSAVEQDLTKRTYYSVSKKPKDYGVITWNSNAEEIFKRFRALSFGSYDNKLCSSKVMLGEDLYIVDSLEILQTSSVHHPGTLTKIDKAGWQIATNNFNIKISKIRSLCGKKQSLETFVEKYNLFVGYKLETLAQSDVGLETITGTSHLNNERYWINQFKNLKPASLPFLPATVASERMTDVYQKVCDIQTSNLLFEKITKTCSEKIERYQVALTFILIYLYRMGNQENLGVFLSGWPNRLQSNCWVKKVFSDKLPFLVNFSGTENFLGCLDHVKKNENLLISKGLYERDLGARYKSVPSIVPITIAIKKNAIDEKNISAETDVCFQIDLKGHISCFVKKVACHDNPNLVHNLDSMLAHFNRLMFSIAKEPLSPISRLELITDDEKNKFLVKWNDTKQDWGAKKEFNSLFENIVNKYPEHEAIVNNGITVTLRELNENSNKLANLLIRREVEKQDLIVVYGASCHRLIALIIAILKVGAVYVPISATSSASKVRTVLQDCHAKMVVTSNFNLPGALLNRFKDVSFLDIDCLWKQKNRECKLNINSDIQGRDLAYAIYTSGTTGKPKGVLIKHGSLTNLILSKISTLKPSKGQRVLQFAPIGFDASIWEIFPTLLSLGTLCIPKRGTILLGRTLADTLNSLEIDSVTLPPTVLQTTSEYNLPFLKEVICAGEACTKATVDYWIKRVKFINAYGPAESTVCATMGEQTQGHINIGKPIANTFVYILDKNMSFVPVGVIGELYISGCGISSGYLNKPELTNDKFLDNIFLNSSGTTMYKTGDLVRWLPDGKLDYVGRADNQIKIRGVMIDLSLVEAEIAGNDAVKQCVAVSRSNDRLGQYLVAYLVLSDIKINIDSLRGELKESLPDHMVPNYFVVLDSLPHTENNKVDINLLPEPGVRRKANSHKSEGGGLDLQGKITSIWEELLLTSPIRKNDDFFSLGGNSLLLSRLFLSLKNAFNVHISFADFAKSPTIEFLCGYVKNDALTSEGMLNLNFEDGCTLDSDITPHNTRSPNITKKNVLLTGVTGFLGRHLFEDLIKENTVERIYCLIRAGSDIEAMKRLESQVAGDSVCYFSSSKIIPIAGDLSLPRLGLSDKRYDELSECVDEIYHSAALVNHLYNYNAMKSTNVAGTIELLRLSANKKLKKFHYISTLTAGKISSEGRKVIFEDFVRDASSAEYMTNGYSQTKWTSERLLCEASNRGLPVYLYRPGWIVGDSEVSSLSMYNNHLYSLIKGCVQLGYAPNCDLNLNILPVDFISKFIVKMGACNYLDKRVYNLCNTTSISWIDIIRNINKQGHKIKLISKDNWIARKLSNIDSTNALFRFLPLHLGIDSWIWSEIHDVDVIHNRNTIMAMQILNLSFSKKDLSSVSDTAHLFNDILCLDYVGS